MSAPAQPPEVAEQEHPPLPQPDPARRVGLAESPPAPAGAHAGGGEGQPDDHPHRAVCLWMDFVLRFVASLIVLAIGVVAAQKPLAPLPWW